MNEYIKKIINYFLIGVLALVPVVVTLEIVFFVKGLVSDLLISVYGVADNIVYTALVFAVSFAIFTYIGYRVSLGRSWIIHTIDQIIQRIPLLNSVYRVTKKIVNLVSGHEKKEQREVVYIEYPKDGLWVPAYVTNKEKDMYILFVPTSPNPTSGFTIIVHESKVVKSKMSIEEATSFIVSVGVDYDKSKEVESLPK